MINSSDASVKEILYSLDSQMNFIIQDLDDTSLFIDETQIDEIKMRVSNILDEHVFKPID